jgi:hypothetical protein
MRGVEQIILDLCRLLDVTIQITIATTLPSNEHGTWLVMRGTIYHLEFTVHLPFNVDYSQSSLIAFT